jgi:polyribonucleotide nucleotidyltransferase
LSPDEGQLELSKLNLLYAANERRTLMVEASASELPEGRLIDALRCAHSAVAEIIATQRKLASCIGRDKRAPPTDNAAEFAQRAAYRAAAETAGLQVRARSPQLSSPKSSPACRADSWITQAASKLFSDASHTKQSRGEAQAELTARMVSKSNSARHASAVIYAFVHRQVEAVRDAHPDASPHMAATAAESTLRNAVRGLALGSTPARADGRTLACIRPLRAVVDILPHTHGSAMFERGMTQARKRAIRDARA